LLALSTIHNNVFNAISYRRQRLDGFLKLGKIVVGNGDDRNHWRFPEHFRGVVDVVRDFLAPPGQ
jgi:hypothetical protein